MLTNIIKVTVSTRKKGKQVIYRNGKEYRCIKKYYSHVLFLHLIHSYTLKPNGNMRRYISKSSPQAHILVFYKHAE